MISPAARASLPRALDEAGRENRRAWIRLGDEMQRLRGFATVDRTKPYNKEAVDAIAATARLIAGPGELPVVWRMWIIPIGEPMVDPVYPCVELRYLSDGYSVHLVRTLNEGTEP